MLGTPLQTIKSAEDRNLFRKLLIGINEPVPPSAIVESMEEARKVMKKLGLPLVIRPAYTLGGTGGGIANNREEFEKIAASGLDASPISQILVETSLVGWKELEYEVMRDSADNCITICNMENIDPMGVHTGDSIVVAPSQTLSDKQYQMLRTSSINIIRQLGIEGGCNVQFALAPGDVVSSTMQNTIQHTSPYYVIEVNPRVSRSSALASKATGYPIARVAAKIAIGKRLDDIPNSVTQKTMAAFEPALDYCVVKIPRWPFDKFPSGDRTIGTQMKATGEVMAIERTFESAFQKAIRSLEITGRSLLWEDSRHVEGNVDPKLLSPHDERLWTLMAALRRGMTPEDLSRATGVDPWFTRAFENIVHMENRLLTEYFDRELLWQAKRLGFSDECIGKLTDRTTEEIRVLRREWGLKPVYKMVDTCAAEFEAYTSYFYSTYEQENEAIAIRGKKAMVLGSGPIRIGQGIEFDYCSVHASWALQEDGIKSVIINSNPETVSTDFDISDRLYFEPLDEESIHDIIDNETIIDENNEPVIPPSVVQFGGQTAISLSQSLDRLELPILGSTAQAIDTASDRDLFEEFLTSVGIPNPPGMAVSNIDQALNVANDIGYPVLLRPSYVLGGRAMEIVHSEVEIGRYMERALEAGAGRKVLIDKYYEGREVEVDAVCDGEDVLIPGIMEHIERAGVHSGDSMAIYPGLTLSSQEISTIVDYTTRIGRSLEVKGLMNIQFVVVGGPAYRSPGHSYDESEDTEVYVLEVNPRSSRTIPFISKVTGVPMVNLAVKVMIGRSLKEQGYKGGLWHKQDLVGVKSPVFSMSKLAGVDTYMGPEMKSTGEVMGIDYNFKAALSKALLAAGHKLPSNGSVLLSIADKDKNDSIPLVKDLFEAGYTFYATEGTSQMISGLNIPVNTIPKILSGQKPNVVDIINEGKVNAVINTVTGDRDVLQDGFQIRRAAVEHRVPCFTSVDTARAASESLLSEAVGYNVKPMKGYLSRY